MRRSIPRTRDCRLFDFSPKAWHLDNKMPRIAQYLGLLLIRLVSSAPLLSGRQSAISTTQIDSYTPYTWFASTGYCASSLTATWSCGGIYLSRLHCDHWVQLNKWIANCEANPDFKPVASGGNGDSVQYWFVGYNPTTKDVIVSHQGTNPSEMWVVQNSTTYHVIRFLQELLQIATPWGCGYY